MKKFWLVLLLVLNGLFSTGQDLSVLPEHEFFELLAGVHSNQGAYLDSTPKFDERGNLIDDQYDIVIKNKVIVQRGILFIESFKGQADSTFTSPFDYLTRADSVGIALQEENILQNRNVVIENCVFYKLSIANFHFQNVKFINCDFRDGFDFTNCEIQNFECYVGPNYKGKNIGASPPTPYYQFTDCSLASVKLTPIRFGDVLFTHSTSGRFEVFADIGPFDARYQIPDNEALNIRLDSAEIEESAIFFASNAVNSFSTLPHELPINYQFRNTSITLGFDTTIKSFAHTIHARMGVNENSTLTFKKVFVSGKKKKLPFELIGDVAEMEIDTCVFQLPFVYNNARVHQRLEINETAFNNISLHRTTFPQNPYFVSINWGQVKEELSLIETGHWAVTEKGVVDTTELFPFVFNPFADADSGNIQHFNELLAIHQNFLQLYESRGDNLAINACNVTLKELETEKIKFLRAQNPGSITKLFQLRFNQLFFVTSDFGTNPLKVFFNVFWIILFFAFVFLLIPHNLDTSTAKPLGKVLITVWFAFDQSLRAFITFGSSQNDIPVARFVALLEGLIGWFHLILFVVTLLYQALL